MGEAKQMRAGDLCVGDFVVFLTFDHGRPCYVQSKVLSVSSNYDGTIDVHCEDDLSLWGAAKDEKVAAVEVD